MLKLTLATASCADSCPLPLRLLGARSPPALDSLRLGLLAKPSRRLLVLPGARCHLLRRRLRLAVNLVAALVPVLPPAPSTPRVIPAGSTARQRLATTGRAVVLRLRRRLVPLEVLPGVPAARSSPAVVVSTLMVALAVACALLVGVRLSAVPTCVLPPPGFVSLLLKPTMNTPHPSQPMYAGSCKRVGRSAWGPPPAWRVRCLLSLPRLQPALSLSLRSNGWSGVSSSSAPCPLRR